MWGSHGVLRLFTGVSGGMVAWLIPATVLLAVVGLVLLGRRRGEGASVVRAAIVASGGSLLLTGAVSSAMAGIYHDYYTVALTPFLGITLALGLGVAWAYRERAWVRGSLAASAVATGALAVFYTSEAGGIYAVVGWVALAALILAAGGLAFAPATALALTRATLTLGMVGALLSPASFALQTAATPHSGSIVTAGPIKAGMGGRGGPGGGGVGGRRNEGAPDGSGTSRSGAAGGGGLLNGAEVSHDLAVALTSDASDEAAHEKRESVSR